MNSPRTPRTRGVMSTDPDMLTLEKFPMEYGYTIKSQVYNARRLANMINHARLHDRPILIPHTREPMTPQQIAAIRQLAGRMPDSPRATRRQRELQVAEMSLERALAQHAPLSDHDITVVIRHRMPEAYPSEVRIPYHRGRFHPENVSSVYTQGEWNHMNLIWETDMVGRLRQRFVQTGSIDL